MNRSTQSEQLHRETGTEAIRVDAPQKPEPSWKLFVQASAAISKQADIRSFGRPEEVLGF